MAATASASSSSSAPSPTSWAGWLADGLADAAQAAGGVASALSSATAAVHRFPSAEGLFLVREGSQLGHLRGTVSRAWCTSGSGREFDLRRIRVAPSGNGGGFVPLASLQSVVREVEIGLELTRHPNVLWCFAAIVENEGSEHCRLLLCEPCVGDLAAHVAVAAAARSGVAAPPQALPLAQLVDVGQQLAFGLGHLAASRVLVGRLDLEGVLRGQDGSWKLADFSRAMRLPSTLSGWRAQRPDGRLFERAADAPPEVRRAGTDTDVNLTPATDVWLLGLLLARLLLPAPGGGPASGDAAGLELAAAPGDLELQDVSRLWVLLHWPLAEEPRQRPMANELAALLGAALETPPEELLEALPHHSRRRCRSVAAAAARQLAVDLAAAEAQGANYGRLIGRLAALPLVELRQELRDPASRARVDSLCANCGVRPPGDEDSGSSAACSEEEEVEDEAASSRRSLAVVAQPCEDKPFEGASTDDASTDSGGSSGSLAPTGSASSRRHHRDCGVDRHDSPADAFGSWEGNQFAADSLFDEVTAPSRDVAAGTPAKTQAAYLDNLIDFSQDDLIDLGGCP